MIFFDSFVELKQVVQDLPQIADTFGKNEFWKENSDGHPFGFSKGDCPRPIVDCRNVQMQDCPGTSEDGEKAAVKY